MKKLILSFLLAFLIFNSAILASEVTYPAKDFSVSINDNTKEYFTVTQENYLTLTIHNDLAEDWFSVVIFGSEDWVKPETSPLRAPTAGTESMKIIISPPRDSIPRIDPYKYFYKVTRVGTNDVEEGYFQFRVKQITDAVIKNFKISCAECTDSVDVSGTAYNVGSEPIDISVVIRVGDQIKIISLGYVSVYGGKKDFTTNFPLKDMPPGDYSVEAKLIDVNGKEMYNQSGSFKITAIENVIYDKDVSSTIFGSAITVTATNRGNTVSDVDLKSVYPQSWYALYSGPTPTGMAIGNDYYWRTVLNPNETKKISYSEIYWPTYVIILFGILIAALIYWQSTTFDFTKSVIGGKRIKTGKEISVSLDFKNKKKEIDKAVVKDFVPAGYSIVSKFETVKPMIKKVSDGIELDWKMSKLKPDEERVFHYTIKPTGEIKERNLPSAKAKVLHDKKVVQKNSNRVSLSPEKEEETKTFSVKVSK